jgi:hypothetical protein
MRLLAAATALVLLTSACGDDDDGGDPPAEETTDDASTDDGGEDEPSDDGGDDEAAGDVPDPCTFITTAELQTIFGVAWEEGTATEDLDLTGQRQCTWGSAEDLTARVVSVAVATDASFRAAFDRGAEELFELTRQTAEDSSSILEPDLGIGDQSYRTSSGIYVLDGDVSYSFLSSGTSDEAVAGLKQMVTQIVDR